MKLFSNLKGDLFGGITEDPLGHAADFRAGANSIAVGIAGNLSMRTGKLVDIDDPTTPTSPVVDPQPTVVPEPDKPEQFFVPMAILVGSVSLLFLFLLLLLLRKRRKDQEEQ